MACTLIPARAATPLTTLEYRILGTTLRPVPEIVTVPKDIRGSLNLQFLRGDGSPAIGLAENLTEARIEGTLRGPSYPAQRVVGELGKPLLFPPLRVAGLYQIDDLRLVRSDGSFVPAEPSSVMVNVIDEVLVSHVTSRPLSLDEIRDKGIAIDESSFRAVEFDVTLVLQGKRIAIQFPVVAPAFKTSTEIIPAAELEDRRVRAELINQELLRGVALPPDLQAAFPDFTVAPIHFEEVMDGDGENERKPPTITGLLVIPGSIGFLNQFFSVQLFTENVAPNGSGLSVNRLSATIQLPTGRDTNSPTDDPLRLARLGADKQTRPTLPIARPGSDAKPGTDDDIALLLPGEAGVAEFLVEGLLEGLHLVKFQLQGDLEGLAAGPTRIRGTASGSVLVRNATFSFTFSHPRTVRSGEPYEASVTLLNTSDFEQNLTSVAINKNALSGTVLLSEERVELGNLKSGQSATATFRFRSQRTGSVLFSNLTTGSDNVKGKLSLFMGVDERGVALSEDSLGYPSWYYDLPESLRRAADRVLGQALSATTAARLPEGVIKPVRSIIESRVIELAEAGQRLRYQDEPRRVLADLALDWQAGRIRDPGFDQIIRTTDAGREWRQALALALNDADFVTADVRLRELGSSYAGLGQAWWLAAAGTKEIELTVRAATGPPGSSDLSELPIQAATYAAPRGGWLGAKPETNRVILWRATTALAQAAFSFLDVRTNGTAELATWSVTGLTAGAEYTLIPDARPPMLTERGTGRTIPASLTAVVEEPPQALSTHQDIRVLTDRVYRHCPMFPWFNWGTVVAVLFNKPMRPEDLVAGAFTFPDGNGARTVQLQPGGRVALLQLHRGIGSFPPARPRRYGLAVAPLPDPRGQASLPTTNEVVMIQGHGASVRGRVLGLDGQPVAGIPVTLTMTDRVGDLCLPADYRAGQVFTDPAGFFTFDFILSDVDFTLAAIDTSRLTDTAAQGILSALIGAVGKDGPDRVRLEELARHATTREAILRAFNVGEVGAAIAAAEGLDRAIYRDFIPFDGGRDGSELSVVLRMRGRGTVAGKVLGANGVAVAGAAVNLFPDTGSRELPRGMFTDDSGHFEFPGVPLGVFSIDVATPDRRSRGVTDRLLTPGQQVSLDVALPDQVVVRGRVRGQVLEPDGRPHANASVYIAEGLLGGGAGGVVASVTTDVDGFFLTKDVPVRDYLAVAVSADGRRKGTRGVHIAEAATATANVTLDGAASVRGIVRFWDGRPAPFARVGGGEDVVRADANGRFTLTGVPTGPANILAGLDGSELPDGITRTGTAVTNVRPGDNDEVEIRLGAYGRIRGVVRDAGGNPVPNVRVAIPVPLGFFWVDANQAGEYEFNRFGLGSYTISAPAPPVKADPEALAAAALSAINNAGSAADADAAAALVGQLANIYVQGTVGRLVTKSFDPGTWGFNTTTIRFDGDTAVADITYLPGAALSGTVVNHQSVPIGAEVSVRGFGPNKQGAPTVKLISTQFTQPDTGEWSASGFLVGPFQVSAQSPLLVGQAELEGLLTPEKPIRTNVVLRFPAQGQVTGRLVGLVFNPDGSPVTNGMVHISFTDDYAISVVNGRFDTQLKLPAGDYRVTATNSESLLVGQSALRLLGGITNYVTVRLLDQGELTVRVLQADGSPARGAAVRLDRYDFPKPTGADGQPGRLELGTGDNGEATFGGLWEGDWSVQVRYQSGVNALELNAGALIEARRTHRLELRLGPSGTIAGEFREGTTGAPIVGANVAARLQQFGGPIFGSTPTDAAGRFEMTGLPLDKYVLIAQNPVNGREAVGSVQFAESGGTSNRVTITLVEEALGEVGGAVREGDGLTPVSGAEVTLVGGRWTRSERRVTTDSSGVFQFPGVPVGPFKLTATALGPGTRGGDASGSGELTTENSPVRLDLQLPGLGNMEITVLAPEGTPAANASVTLQSGVGVAGPADTDFAGVARFRGVPLGDISFKAVSRQPGRSSSVAQGRASLTQHGETVAATVRLLPVGRLTGTLSDSQGQPSQNSRIELRARGLEEGNGEQNRSTLTQADGTFTLEDLPLGPWSLTAESGPFAAFAGGTFTVAQPEAQITLQLGGSGSVMGSISTEDGSELVGVPITFEFATQGGGTGFKKVLTGPLGRFRADGLPIQTDLQLSVLVPEINGRAFRTPQIAADGQITDLGVIRLDQHAPELTEVLPSDGAVEVIETNPVVLTFSERLHPGSLLDRSGIYLQEGDLRVPAEITLTEIDTLAGPVTRVSLQPQERLKSQQTYNLLVLGGDQVGSGGLPSALGPEDLVFRPLIRTLVTRFTVRDYLPPVVLNEFPAAGANEIEPAAVARFEFDEAIDTNRLDLVVSGSGGRVEGAVGVNPNQRLISFVPLRPLLPNTAYQAELRSVFDLSGNLMVPRTNRFTTVDNLGPGLADLRLAPGQRAVPNATVSLVAVLQRAEAEASVEFLRGATSVGLATVGPEFTLAVRLPDLSVGGQVTYTAVGIDRFGNRGEPRLLTLTLRANEPPGLTLIRGLGATGPVPTGDVLSLLVKASDDARLRQVVVEGTGAGTARWVFDLSDNSFEQLVSLRLPAKLVAGAPYVFRATARDDSGAQTISDPLSVPTRDATAPTIDVVAPPEAGRIDPRAPLTIPITVADNSGGVTLTARLDVQNQSFASQELMVGLTPNADTVKAFVFDLSSVVNGGSLEMEFTATDAAGNRTVVRLTRRIRSVVGPRLNEIVTYNGDVLPSARLQSPWLPYVLFRFDQSLNADRSLNEYLIVTNGAGSPVPFSVALNNQVVVYFEGPPLPPGGQVNVVLRPGLTDAEGNPAQLADGADFPPEGIVATFGVADFHQLLVNNNTPIVPGQQFLFDILHDQEFSGWRGSLNGEFGFFAGTPGAGEGSRIQVTLPADATTARLHVEASVAGRDPYVLPDIDLRIVPRSGDDDGDGLPNGWEADRGNPQLGRLFDPFDSADAAQDFDFDGLSNLVEFRLGTEIYDPDTDNDGLSDSAESPVRDGCPSAFQADSDGDGFRDGGDEAPCDPGESLVLAPTQVTILAGLASTNVLELTAQNLGLNSGSLIFTDAEAHPPWVSFADFSAVGENPVSRQLVLRPSFANVGEFDVPLTLRATRRFNQVVSNVVLRITVLRNTNVPITRWKSPLSGDWEVAANWTAGRPGFGTNAVIDLPGDYTVTIRQPAVVESLRLGGATGTQTLVQMSPLELNDASEILARGVYQQQSSLRGQGALTVAGQWNWDSVFVEPSGGAVTIHPGGVWRLTTGRHSLGRFVENRGETHLIAGTELSLEGVTLRNAGLMVIPGSPAAQNRSQVYGANGARFIHTGQLLLTGTDRVQFGAVIFEHRGQIDWTTSSLRFLGGGTNAARLEVPVSKSLDIGGNWTHEPAAFIGGAGELRFSSGRHLVDGAFEPTGPVEFNVTLARFKNAVSTPLRATVTSGDVEFDAAQSFDTLVLRSGSLGGAGERTLLNRLDWFGGDFEGPGRFVIGAQAIVICSGQGRFVRCDVENRGRFEFQGNAEIYMDPSVFRNTGLVIAPGMVGGSGRFWNRRGPLSRVINEGQIRVPGPGDTDFTLVQCENHGLITIESGRLTLSAGGANTGRIEFSGTPGLLEISGDFLHDTSGVITGDGTVSLTGGAHEFRASLDLPVLSVGGTATLVGPGRLRVGRRFDWTGGSLRQAGGLIIEPDATASLGGVNGGHLELDTLLENRGQALVSPGTYLNFDVALLRNLGRWEMPGQTSYSWRRLDGSRVFENLGVLVKGTNTVTFSRVDLLNRGTLEFEAGTLQLDRTVNESAILVPAGGKLEVSPSSTLTGFAQTAAGSVGGPGALEFSAGVHDLAGGVHPTGPLLINGGTVLVHQALISSDLTTLQSGTLTLPAGGTLARLNLQSGDLVVGQRLEIVGDVTWANTGLSGEGTVYLGPQVRVQRAPGFPVLALRLENAGEMTFAAHSGFYFQGGTWVNLAGGTVRLLGVESFLAFQASTNLFRNEGTLIKANPGAATFTVPVVNAGQIDLQGGKIVLTDGSLHRGAWNLATAGELELQGTDAHVFAAGTSFTGNGSIQFSTSVEAVLEADLNFGAAQVAFQGNATWTGNFTLANSAGGSMVVELGLLRLAGPLNIGGVLRVERFGSVKMEGSLALQSGARLVNLGVRVNGESNIRVRPPQLWDNAQVDGVQPDVIPAPVPLRIVQILVQDPPVGLLTARRTQTGPTVHLRWQDAPGAQHGIEVSSDLQHWSPITAELGEIRPGSFTASLPAGTPTARYLRVVRR